MNKILFIDRDGVINVDPIGDYIKKWDDFRFEGRALDALKRLSNAGFEIIIISNQAGIGDGVYPESTLWEIHEKMTHIFKEEGIAYLDAFYCLHGKNDGCECRKPRTGLFQRAAQKFKFDPAQTYFIGDKISDVQAGKSFGLRTLFVRTGHGAQEENKITPPTRPEKIFDSLWEAAKSLAP